MFVLGAVLIIVLLAELIAWRLPEDLDCNSHQRGETVVRPGQQLNDHGKWLHVNGHGKRPHTWPQSAQEALADGTGAVRDVAMGIAAALSCEH